MSTKRNPQTLKSLEQRRRLAAELLRRGVRPAEVARWVESSRQSVMRWGRLLEQVGLRGLRRAGRVGGPPLLADREPKQLGQPLKARSLEGGHRQGRWTCARVG